MLKIIYCMIDVLYEYTYYVSIICKMHKMRSTYLYLKEKNSKKINV